MPRKNLQLLGTTALFIACKVEEIFVPAGHALAARFVWITDNTYKVHEVCFYCLTLSYLVALNISDFVLVCLILITF